MENTDCDFFDAFDEFDIVEITRSEIEMILNRSSIGIDDEVEMAYAFERNMIVLTGNDLRLHMLKHERSESARNAKVKGGSGGGGSGSFIMKAATQAILGLCAKVAVDKGVISFFESSSPRWFEAYEKAGAGVGLVMVMGGMVLVEKKPGLSKAMLKFGAVMIALAILIPMAASLPPVMAWVFGVLAASIVIVTAILG